MADPQQLAILQQGVEAWNAWGKAHPQTQVDLNGADLFGADLFGANLSGANLRYANLSGANLTEANFTEANLFGTNLTEAHLIRANLSGANLSGADLIEALLDGADLNGANLYRADLNGANLFGVDLNGANLNRANLNRANLRYADLSGANLTATDMTDATVGATYFTDLDLRTVKGLETLDHRSASHVSIVTLYRSEGQIPDSFLRKTGVPEDFLAYLPSLVNKAIEYYTCFISYSSKDQEFVERLYADLQSKGVRCWYAPEDLKTGDKIRDRIDQSIRLHDKLLLVLSEHSVNSAWVEFEVEAAIAKENSKNTLMLFPIRLDSTVKDSPTSWAAHIRRTRNITDFSNWKQHDAYQKVLSRLLRDLKPEMRPIAKQE